MISRLQSPLILPNYTNVELCFSQVNIFIGPNNSGKTKLLYLLHASLCAAFNRRNDLPQDLESLFRSTSKEGQMSKIEYKISDTVKKHGTYNGELVTVDKQCFDQANNARFKLLGTSRRFSSNFNTRDKDDVKRRADQQPGADGILAELVDYPRLRPILVYELQRLFGVNTSFEEVGYNLTLLAQTSPTSKISFSQQGDGIQDYLALFFYLYHPDYKVILIDEPENSLHPQLQRVFIKRLREIAREQNKQVFLTSHSPYMVLPNVITDLQGIFLMRPHPSEPRIQELSSLIPKEEEKREAFISYLPNLDPGIAEIFFSRGVLLVEGPTERQFIKYLSSRVGRDPHELDISIVESNGLSLMPSLIKLTAQLVKHWRAIADSDLLTRTDKRFIEYRTDMETALEITGIKWADTAIHESLYKKGLHVLPGNGLETFYQSPEAKKYGNLNFVSPSDKGWLMECEISYAKGLSIKDVEETYAPLLKPLNDLREAIKSEHPITNSLIELMRDYLQDEGIRIHRHIFRNKLTVDQVKNDRKLQQSLKDYKLEYTAYDNYRLFPIECSELKIICKGPEIRVVKLSPEKILISATIDEQIIDHPVTTDEVEI